MSSCQLYNHDKVNASRKISFLAQPITTCQSAVLLQNISYGSEFGPHIHNWIIKKKKNPPEFRKNAMMNFKSHKRYRRSCWENVRNAGDKPVMNIETAIVSTSTGGKWLTASWQWLNNQSATWMGVIPDAICCPCVGRRGAFSTRFQSAICFPFWTRI